MFECWNIQSTSNSIEFILNSKAAQNVMPIQLKLMYNFRCMMKFIWMDNCIQVNQWWSLVNDQMFYDSHKTWNGHFIYWMGGKLNKSYVNSTNSCVRRRFHCLETVSGAVHIYTIPEWMWCDVFVWPASDKMLWSVCVQHVEVTMKFHFLAMKHHQTTTTVRNLVRVLIS